MERELMVVRLLPFHQGPLLMLLDAVNVSRDSERQIGMIRGSDFECSLSMLVFAILRI